MRTDKVRKYEITLPKCLHLLTHMHPNELNLPNFNPLTYLAVENKKIAVVTVVI